MLTRVHPLRIILAGVTLLFVAGTLNAQVTANPSSLSFGDEQVGLLSPAQTVQVTQNSLNPHSYSISGPDSADFPWASSGTPTPEINVAFWPRFPGTKSAVFTITDTTTNTSVTVPLTGNAVLNGTFHIVASFSAKVLDLASSSPLDGTPVEQSALDGTSQQGWKFVPTGDGYYEIVNSVTGKVLDVTGASTQDGARIQQYDYWGGFNQQWQVTPVDDAHYQIVNRLSGKSLDVTNGSNLNGTPIQQWTYVGDGQQLWAIIPATPYVIAASSSLILNTNPYLKVLDVLNGSTANEAPIQQWSSNGNRQQQWEFMPESRDFYVILNRLSGKVLDDTNASTSSGTLMQQFDYVGGTNQFWKFVPRIPDDRGIPLNDGLTFFITNGMSGLALETGGSYSDGAFIEQSSNGRAWWFAPIGTYLIQNAYSTLVLDIPGGSTASGTAVQQWQSNGNLQQQWQAVPILRFPTDLRFPLPNTFIPVIFVNVLTGKALDVAGGSMSDQATIVQSDLNGSQSQVWSLQGISNSSNWKVINANSQKALDDTNASTSNGNLMQQYGYWGGLNQQWQFVPQP